MDIGAQLRAAREARGLSLGTLSERTRVQLRFLTAIEQNDLTLIPPRPFGRGFVRAYADEVGLEPEDTANQYFAQFPSTRTPGEVRVLVIKPDILLDSSSVLASQWGGLATAVAILILVVATAVSLGRRGETTTEARVSESRPPAAPQEKPVGAAASAQAAQPPVGTTGGTRTEPVAPLRIEFTITRVCWISAKADGQQIIYRLLQPGERQTLTASKEVQLRVGDAGAVTWTVNGRNPGPMGAAGQVRDISITPENAATVR
jgi:cytoskeleton protein RodZ